MSSRPTRSTRARSRTGSKPSEKPYREKQNKKAKKTKNKQTNKNDTQIPKKKKNAQINITNDENKISRR